MQVEVKLNANSISLSTSLILNITSESFPHISKKALVYSGSTHCFIDHSLIWRFKITTRSISPIPLTLSDGRTSSMITEAVELPICFPPNNLFVRGQPHFYSETISEFFQLWPWIPLAFFGLRPPPNPRNALEFFLLWASSSNPQRHHVLLPPQHLTQYLLWRPLQDLHLLWR